MEKKNILIVVDYQKDFVDGALGFESAKNLDKGISDLMQKYLDDPNGVVICTFDTHEENYLDTQEGKKLPVKHCIRGEEGWELYGEAYNVAERNKEQVAFIEKPTFGSYNLAKRLVSIDGTCGGINSITLVGVVTNMCVISNAVMAKAACPEAEIIIKKDLVDSFDKELHQKALDVMASMQMTVE